MKFLARFALVILLLGVCICKPVIGESLNLSAVVKDTAIIFSGYTSPNSFVSIIEGSTIIGTTSSDANGFFSKYVSSITGIHTIDIKTTDPHTDAGVMPGIEFNLILIDHQEMLIGNIYMPTTLNINSNHFVRGDTVTISGYTKPSSQIEISVGGTRNVVNTVSSDANGFFSLSIPANTLPTGDYTLNTQLLIPGIIDNSTISGEVLFSVFNEVLITEAPVNPTSVPASGNCIYDYPRICIFNKENQGIIVSKDEFLTFLIGFTKNLNRGTGGDYLPLTGDADKVYDINEDGKVDAEDLSIMLYYWRGDTSLIKYFFNNTDNDDTLGLSGNSSNIQAVKQDTLSSTLILQGFTILTIIVIEFIIIGFTLNAILNLWPEHSYCIFCFSKKIFGRKEQDCKYCQERIDNNKTKSPKTIRLILLGSLIVLIVSNISAVLLILSLTRGIISQPELSLEQQFNNQTSDTTLVDIMVNTYQPINLVQANVHFDSSKYIVKDILFDKSFADIVVKKDFSNTDGTIGILAGLPNPGFLGKGVLARVVLERKQTGICNIQFLSSTKVFANDGKGTNLLSKSVNTTIEIK